MSIPAERLPAYFGILLALKARKNVKVTINGQSYSTKDAARFYCGSEALTYWGIRRHYCAWLVGEINGTNV